MKLVVYKIFTFPAETSQIAFISMVIAIYLNGTLKLNANSIIHMYIRTVHTISDWLTVPEPWLVFSRQKKTFQLWKRASRDFSFYLPVVGHSTRWYIHFFVVFFLSSRVHTCCTACGVIWWVACKCHLRYTALQPALTLALVRNPHIDGFGIDWQKSHQSYTAARTTLAARNLRAINIRK